MAHAAAPLRRVRDFLQEEYERAFRHEHWHIGLVDAPIHAFLEPDTPLEVHWLPLPDRGKYFADPFGRVLNNGHVILFEEFEFRSNKGVISWVHQEAGTTTAPQVALDLPFHMSYPFLLEDGGRLFCIPETAQAREVGLYRADKFPRRWTKVATLIRGVAALDSTVFRRDGMFWLLCTDDEDGPFSKLRIWYARNLMGPWTAHPSNPVKTDIRSARPAGTPFEFEGNLYRPAQDSSVTYGGSVVLNRIVRLTTTEFHEERVVAVNPFRDGAYVHGVHTLSSLGNRTLVDGKRFSFDRHAMVRNLRDSVENRWGRMVLRR